MTAIQTKDRQNTNPSILKMENVSFSYDGIRHILDDINFDIREGEMISIVGKNGAGKSTLSKLLCGFEKEDRGIICYQGRGYQRQDHQRTRRNHRGGHAKPQPDDLQTDDL